MDVFELGAKITLDKSGYEDGLNDAKKSSSSFFSAIGNGLKVVGQVATTVFTLAATGVVTLTKKSVEAYAQYEQLVGGVETLFKDSSDAVMKYAENAYKTAGLSANAYMETVTSFSASLIQSLDGDTARAAKVADIAITDMADNANKMGTSIEMLQNSYAGFAKGNFTMLDNLKLGYGGTKTEMERLLKDAQKLSGIKYDISSFADIAEAIHVIQQNMDISGISYEEAMARVASGELTLAEATELMGTTAKEAATTIEGSLGMMKGAWENLVVGMADETADMDALINNFVGSTLTVADNIMPRIEQSLAGIGMLVEGIAPLIGEKLPEMVKSVLPSLLNAAATLVASVVGALPGLLNSILPVVIQSALDVVNALVNTIMQNGSTLLRTGFNACMQIVNGLASAIPDIIESAITIISELVNTLTSPDSLNDLLDTALTLIESIVNGLIDNLPLLVESAIQLIENLVIFITDPENLNKIINMAVKLVKTIVNGLVDAIPELVDATIQLIKALVEFLLDPDNIMTLVNGALEIVLAIAGGLIAAIFELDEAATELIDELKKNFEETDWKKVGEDIIDSLLKGFKEAWKNVKEWFTNAWSNLFKGKSFSFSTSSVGSSIAGAIKGYSTGLNYVPYDEFPALLHRGEAVLTAAEARAWRKGQTAPVAAGVTINQYIQSVPQTPVEFAAATEAYMEQARWSL